MATQMEEEERVVATTEDDSECALFRNISHDSHDSCNALVPYRGDSYLELSWEADSAWLVCTIHNLGSTGIHMALP